jgi:hypothetical protein
VEQGSFTARLGAYPTPGEARLLPGISGAKLDKLITKRYYTSSAHDGMACGSLSLGPGPSPSPLLGGKGMKPSLVNRVALASLLALLLATPLLAGCVQVQVTDDNREPVTPTLYGELTSPREVRDLAILGIEFNPPLQFQEVIAAGKVTLLVAVENRGLIVEEGVVVEAHLVGANETDVLVRRADRIGTLAPGEVKLIRFENMALVPYRPAYVLTVAVAPASGESRVTDNQRSYRLQVSVPSSTPPSPTPTPTPSPTPSPTPTPTPVLSRFSAPTPVPAP